MIPEAEAFLKALVERYQPAPDFVDRIRGPVERIFEGRFSPDDRDRLLRLAEETVRRHAENRATLEKARTEIREAVASLYASFFGRLLPMVEGAASRLQNAASSGSIPPTLPEPLLFGQFLLSRGLVDREALTVALKEQERRRPAMGELAVQNGFLNRSELYFVLEAQQESKTRFGETALKEGYLTREQIESLVREQKGQTPKLGELLVEAGALPPQELSPLLADFERSQGR